MKRGLGGEIAVFRTRSLYLVNELVFLLDNCCTFKYLANRESGVCVVCSVLSDSKNLFFKVLSLCMIFVSLPLILLSCPRVCVPWWAHGGQRTASRLFSPSTLF